MRHQRRSTFLVLTGLVLTLDASAGRAFSAVTTSRSVAVSPGDTRWVTAVGDGCPTFNWGAVEGALHYDLVVYGAEVGDDAAPVLQVTLPGSATGWTPSLERCLTAGGSYAWTVRARAKKNDTEWSEPRLFSVATRPSVREVNDALEVLRRYREGLETSEDPAAGSVISEAVPEPGRQAGAGDGEAKRDEPVLKGIGKREARPATVASVPDGQELLGAKLPGPAALAPTLGPAGLSVDGQVHLGSASAVFKDGALFLWSDAGANTALGKNALSSNSTGANNMAFGDSALTSNTYGEANVAIGTSALSNNESGNSNVALGSDALLQNTSGKYNIAIGQRAMRNSYTTKYNVAIGVGALSNTTADGGTAIGEAALKKNTSGPNNTATGFRALSSNTTGSGNTAIGTDALMKNEGNPTPLPFIGSYNTAVGAYALLENISGAYNVAVGAFALRNSTNGNNVAIGSGALNGLKNLGVYGRYGSENIAIGDASGNQILDGNRNIVIGNPGYPGDAFTIRIGRRADQVAPQNRAFIQGIRGITTGVADAGGVLIDSKGQLGTINSSRRFKEDIEDMKTVSDRLLDLRPVTFRYKKAFEDGLKPIQFGLIAEEVAAVFPELVIYDEEGRPETVKYHLLSSLLLNELQKQGKAMGAQARVNQEQAQELAKLAALKRQLAELEDVKARLIRLEAMETRPPRRAAVADRGRSSPLSGGS